MFLDGESPAPGPSLGPGSDGQARGGSGPADGIAGASSREPVRPTGGEGGSGALAGGEGPDAAPAESTSAGDSTTPMQESDRELEALRARNLAERRASFEQMIRARAVRIADEVGLGTGAEERIAQVYLDEQDRIDAIRAAYAAGPPSREARTKLREDLRGLKSWRHERFSELFGASAAEAIAAFKDQAAIESAGLVLDPDPGSPGPK